MRPKSLNAEDTEDATGAEAATLRIVSEFLRVLSDLCVLCVSALPSRRSLFRHHFHARRDLKRRLQRAVHGTAFRVHAMDAVYPFLHFFRIRRAQMKGHVHALDHQYFSIG